MEEELTATEIPSVSADDASEIVEEEPKLIELKPVSYDVADMSNGKTEVFDKMDIDNHNVDFDQVDKDADADTETSAQSEHTAESIDTPKESVPKMNGVLKHSDGRKSTKKPVTSPSTTPGKSRYGRIRKPKLSTDFISVDRKSFAVLSNTSSYEHVYADETPRKPTAAKKPRKSLAKSTKLESPKQDETPKSLTKEPIDKVSYITESISVDIKPVVKSSSSKTPPKSKPNQPKEPEPSVSPLNCKDTLKTYSRKGESAVAGNTPEEENQIVNVDEEKLSQINHVELSWKVGDVAWAKIGCYSYWPSIVTLEYGSSIYVKSVGNRRLAVHVQFFGDRGRRSWVLTSSLIKYQSKEQFLQLKQQYKKDKIRFKYFLIKPTFQDLWEKAVTEADTVLKLPHEERIPYYQSLYPISEESYAAEMNSTKPKRPIMRRKKNPDERRGRKRKIIPDAVNTSPTNLATKKIRQNATEPKPEETLAGEESKKRRQPIDEHTKKRRAFMRRMNKILRQSNTNDYASKGTKNGVKLQRMKNAKFNKLLHKENERKKHLEAGASSPNELEKKKDISVYDFESDEETDIFIGTYNSRFTPQLLAKIEQDKDETKKSESSTEESSNEVGQTSLSSNEIKARRLFDQDKPPKNIVRGRGRPAMTSKFSKLFEHRKGPKGGAKFKNTGRSRPKGARGRPKKKMLGSIGGKPNNQEVASASPAKEIHREEEIGDFEVFKEKMMDKVDAEHPQFNDEEIDEHMKKLWSELDDTEKATYKPENEFDIHEELEETVNDVVGAGEDDDETKPDEKSRSSSPSSAPSGSRPKKLSNLFTGYKVEKVCQICDKTGDTVKCRGPCGGTFHVECVQKLANSVSAAKTPPRRGRRKKSSIKPDTSNDDVDVNKPNESNAKTRKSAGAGDSSKEDDKSKEEFVKPILRRSRRVAQESGEKIENVKDDIAEAEKSHEIKPEKMEVDEASEVTENNQKSDDSKKPESETTLPEDATEDVTKKETDEIEPEKMTETPPDDATSTELETTTEERDIKPEESDKKPEESDKKPEESDKKPQESDKKPQESDEKPQESDKKPEESTSAESTKSDPCDAAKDDVSDVSSENQSNSGKSDKSNGGVDFLCNLCARGVTYPCFACGKDTQEKTGETERFSCYLPTCAKVFHKECLKSWPQATWGLNSGKQKNGASSGTPKESLLCPQHYCHTCISDNPAVLKNRQSQAKLVRCIKCPTTYHQSVHCIPAGSQLLTMNQIICPRHYVPPKMKSTHVNTSWCFICCIGGSLICCEECPTSFHAECLKLSPEEYEGRYICDDCQTGRYLLYGEIVWVKLGHYRWWPALILYPQEVPENISNMPHRRGEFVVRFFGSHDYNWVNRGRAFVYQEGDSGRKNCNRTGVDLTFEKALREAEEAHQKLKSDKALRDEEAKVGMKPPRYTRIKTNKPIGNVRIVELNTSNIPECRCDPNSDRPCAPESDCLNRILLVECNPRVCAAGERCLNQAFEKRVYPPLIPYRTDRRGWGLKTLVEIKKGDFIIEYVGEMIDEEEYKRRVNHMHKNQEENYYFLTIDNNRMLDAGPKGNVSRFMNHSCDPNCETQKWTVNGDTRVGLFAVKDISANEELVFNYNLATLGNEKKPCFCGSEKCSGYIGMKAPKNGNGNGNEEETRKRSNEENRKRSSEDNKGKLSSQRGRKKIKRKRKPLGKRVSPMKKHKPAKPVESPRDEAKDEGESAEIPNDPPCDAATKPEVEQSPSSATKPDQEVSEPTKEPGNSDNDETLVAENTESAETPEPEDDAKPEPTKKSVKISKLKKKAKGIRGKKTLPLKKRGKEKLLKRGRKIYVNSKMAKSAKKNVENRVLGKRGRKPHLTDEDRELALCKSLKKRMQKKLRLMIGISKLDDKCWMCGEKGELIFCDNKKCPRGYHVMCVKKFKLPKGRWLCPWHYCTVCRSKCKVVKCSRCVNSFCRLHIENNVFVNCEDDLICRDHKSEYLADKLQVLSNVSAELNTSTDNDSLNFTDSSNPPIEPESLLIPLKLAKPRSRLPSAAKLRKSFVPFIKIKEEALSDVENEPEPRASPVVGESRNVARRSRKPIRHIAIENQGSIDNMSIDDFIEVHHVDSMEVTDDENDAASTASSEDKPNSSFVNSTEESDDDYLDVEMEVINDDSS